MINLLNELRRSLSWVLTIVGAGGSGKTSTMWYILEHWFPEEKIWLWRYPQRVLDALPDKIRERARRVEDYEDLFKQHRSGVKLDYDNFIELFRSLAPGGILVTDDTPLHLLSRSTSDSKNKDGIQNDAIGRHNDFKFIRVAQNTILVDKGSFEALDQYSLRCRMTYLQSITEREEVRELQLRINDHLDLTAVEWGLNEYERKGLRYCPETEETLLFPDIDWSSEIVSKPYRGFYVKSGELVDSRIKKVGSTVG